MYLTATTDLDRLFSGLPTEDIARRLEKRPGVNNKPKTEAKEEEERARVYSFAPVVFRAVFYRQLCACGTKQEVFAGVFREVVTQSECGEVKTFQPVPADTLAGRRPATRVTNDTPIPFCFACLPEFFEEGK